MPLSAADRPWFKYENAFFEAYSDAPEKRVLRLLEELENFRAAVEQIVAFEIPPGAAKTQVIIFRSGREFRKIADSRDTAAFMITHSGMPHIVMPSGRANEISRAIIRHEFAHVLLAYSNLRLPLWYHEGFAEYMSATQFRDKGTRFTIGEAPFREWAPASLVPWNELLSDDFDYHSARTGYTMSNAYLQSWVLVHYLLHADESSHYPKLSEYLGRYAAGETSQQAFQTVFGMPASEFGESVMRNYKSTTAYVMNFEPEIQDHDFVRSDADTQRIRSVIHDIQAQLAAWRD